MHISDNELIDLDPDEPPRSGTWLDSEDEVLANITADEIAAGERLRELIDVDDDDDSGLQYLGGVER